MFLNSLNDRQKLLFIELAIKAAESNELVALEEKNMLKAFSIEMGIAPIYQTNKDLDSIVDNITANSTEKERKIILFETLGIIISDTIFDDREKIFINKIVEKFKLDSCLVDEMVKLLFEYKKICQDIEEIII